MTFIHIGELSKVTGKASGLYLVRHESADYYTLGKAVRETIRSRLNKHAKPQDLASKTSRHHFHPFVSTVFCADLTGWEAIDIALAENALYAAVATKYAFLAMSVFKAPRNADFADIISRLEDDLKKIYSVRKQALLENGK